MANVEQITQTYQNVAERFIAETKPDSAEKLAAIWAFAEYLDKANALDDKLVIAALTEAANTRGQIADALAARLAQAIGPEAVREIVAEFRLKTRRAATKPVPKRGKE